MTYAGAMQPASPALSRRMLFTVTIFTGSFLLFLIQPMIARMALPRLGGAPAVWNSAMLVYQALLLGGYAYAHLLTRLSGRTQALTHVSLLLLAAFSLPIGLSAAVPSAEANIFLWVPWLFLTSIGPLFFVISAQAPLLQHWFARTGGEDPYPLYAASNLGSFMGLLAYPILLEPLITVSTQRLIWTSGYGLLLLLVLGCALGLGRAAAGGPQPLDEGRQIDRRAVAKWVWLAFIPTGLMLSTTLFITTDVMAMPLLWVLPLGLYLLSFTVAFAAHSGAAKLISTVAPYLLVPAAASMFIGERIPLPIRVGILLLTLFAVAVACHFKLYQDRPGTRHLTGFYLALSVGGVLGGLFCALIAPLIFDWTYEYPLLLIAAATAILPGIPLVRFGNGLGRPSSSRIAFALSAAVLVAAMTIAYNGDADFARYMAFAALVVGWMAVPSRPLLISIMLAVMMVLGGWEKLRLSASPGHMIRTYFGVYSVVERDGIRQLLHGTTLHGVQLLAPGQERSPTTYYGRRSGVGRALEAAPTIFGTGARISVIGLGTGTLACYKRPDQRWTFFELDPAVVDLATNPRQFSFVPACAPDSRIVIGDARLKLADDSSGQADILVVDAFSSDAVPMHLLTREAFALYGRHLQRDGLLLVHISNRHLDLEPVVGAAPDWEIRKGESVHEWDRDRTTPSDWMALSRSPETLAALERHSGNGFWKASTKPPLPWTDDYASLLSVLK